MNTTSKGWLGIACGAFAVGGRGTGTEAVVDDCDGSSVTMSSLSTLKNASETVTD